MNKSVRLCLVFCLTFQLPRQADIYVSYSLTKPELWELQEMFAIDQHKQIGEFMEFQE